MDESSEVLFVLGFFFLSKGDMGVFIVSGDSLDLLREVHPSVRGAMSMGQGQETKL